MNYAAEIERMKISNEAMFQLIRKTQNEVALIRAKVDSFIDETNEICTIRDIVSRINKLENKLIMLSSMEKDTTEQNLSLTIS